jgi:hypothetical protein
LRAWLAREGSILERAGTTAGHRVAVDSFFARQACRVVAGNNPVIEELSPLIEPFIPSNNAKADFDVEL